MHACSYSNFILTRRDLKLLASGAELQPGNHITGNTCTGDKSSRTRAESEFNSLWQTYLDAIQSLLPLLCHNMETRTSCGKVNADLTNRVPLLIFAISTHWRWRLTLMTNDNLIDHQKMRESRLFDRVASVCVCTIDMIWGAEWQIYFFHAPYHYQGGEIKRGRTCKCRRLPLAVLSPYHFWQGDFSMLTKMSLFKSELN